jgi:hypothetical protein
VCFGGPTLPSTSIARRIVISPAARSTRPALYVVVVARDCGLAQRQLDRMATAFEHDDADAARAL